MFHSDKISVKTTKDAEDVLSVYKCSTLKKPYVKTTKDAEDLISVYKCSTLIKPSGKTRTKLEETSPKVSFLSIYCF